MAYHLGYWVRIQGRRILKGTNYVGRRMNSKVAYPALSFIFLLFIITMYRCNYSYTMIPTEAENESRALPKFIVDFFEAYREETGLPVTHMAKRSPDSSSCLPKFSMLKLSEGFEKCAMSGNMELYLDSYVEAWKELDKFLISLGKAFSFVSSDVQSKLSILEDFRKSPEKDGYETVEKMILHEKKKKMINYKEAPSSKVRASGSRTLLRLHRALKFLLVLFAKLAKNDDNGKVSVMAYNAYRASPMAMYHPWIIQKAVGIAVYMLPDRDKFIKSLCQELSDEDLIKLSLKTSESMDAVYEYTQALYRWIDNFLPFATISGFDIQRLSVGSSLRMRQRKNSRTTC